MKNKTRYLLCLVALGAGLAYGCGHENTSYGTMVFGQTAGQCGPGSFMKQALPDTVDAMVIRVSDAGQTVITRRIEKQELSESGVLIPELKPGTYQVSIAACGGGKALYGTKIDDVRVKENTKTLVRAFLPALGALNCLGGDNISPLIPDFYGDSFHDDNATAFSCAVNSGGQTWIFGGFGVQNIGTDPMATLKAGTSVWLYRRDLGLFIRPRMPNGDPMVLPGPWAAGACMDMSDGILLVGGGTDASLAPGDYPGTKPPLVVRSSDKIAKTAYLVRPGRPVQTLTLPQPVYPYASITRMSDTEFMACGGMKPDGSAVAYCLDFTMKGEKFTFTKTPLNTARYGHSAIALPDGKLLIIGGFAPGATDMPAELVVPGGTNETLSGMDPSAFQAAWLMPEDKDGKARVLVIGGNDVKSGTQKRALILELGGTGKTGYNLSNAKLENPHINDTWTQVSLPSTGMLNGQPVLAYGFRFFAKTKDTDCHGDVCLPDTINILNVDNNTVTNHPMSDTSSRLGAAIVPVGHNMLIFGGIISGEGSHIFSTARTAMLLTTQDKELSELCSGK